MTAVNVQTASALYSVTGVGYAPAGSITRTAAAAPAQAAPPAGADDPAAAAVAAATAEMAAKGPASAAAGPSVQQELSEGELAALRLLLEGAVLCNDSHLNVATDEATGGAATGGSWPVHVHACTGGAHPAIHRRRMVCGYCMC